MIFVGSIVYLIYNINLAIKSYGSISSIINPLIVLTTSLYALCKPIKADEEMVLDVVEEVNVEEVIKKEDIEKTEEVKNEKEEKKEQNAKKTSSKKSNNNKKKNTKKQNTKSDK